MTKGRVWSESLVETADQRDHPLGPFGHLGVACASREEIDRLYAEACREGRPTRAPIAVR
jgi:lactoylglutathione lyase